MDGWVDEWILDTVEESIDKHTSHLSGVMTCITTSSS